MMFDRVYTQKDLDDAVAEAKRMPTPLAPASRSVSVPVANTRTVIIPSEFPHGFGYAGNRAHLSDYVRAYLQKCWDALSDEFKLRHLTNLHDDLDRSTAIAATQPVA